MAGYTSHDIVMDHSPQPMFPCVVENLCMQILSTTTWPTTLIVTCQRQGQILIVSITCVCPPKLCSLVLPHNLFIGASQYQLRVSDPFWPNRDLMIVQPWKSSPENGEKSKLSILLEVYFYRGQIASLARSTCMIVRKTHRRLGLSAQNII